ncbi:MULTISPECIES: nitroreductase family protein [unclassified Granulicatella]|uniref:nitroreductase family protein n=1 Tax=unclassified Granulicatella TaxID=2630493 RepID=UPI001073EBD1|nr:MULTISPECIES: nitroreductase family protein [unclassified Granulicatella]MBF0780534.1 nitroreductase family protein [Granulicatella sp. 19428wC4_WM01]TFU94939.1 NADPH-dependent oxidoreductase [Granulicatella sp. WM01]
MNNTIHLLKNHRTTRHFVKGKTMSHEHLQNILEASIQAPTYMNGQHFSIIVVENQQTKEQLVEWTPRNPHIASSSVFLLFCMDFSHLQVASDYRQASFDVEDNPDVLMIGTVDVALAMQNAIIAAESLGYGTVCVGGVRHIANHIIKQFKLPKYVYPICGLSIGEIDTTQEVERVKPRLPKVFKETYTQPVKLEDVQGYDKTMRLFAEKRETKEWSQKFADFYEKRPNPKTTDWLKEQGF